MTKTQLYRSLLAILGSIGIGLSLYDNGFGMLLYYTTLSNVLIIAFLIYLVLWEKRYGDSNQSEQLLRQKAAVTMAIAITFLVYHFLLAAKASPEEFYRFRNMIVHYLVPIGVIMDTLLLDRTKVYKWFDPLTWTLLPIAYFIFAIFNGLVLQWPIPGAKDSPFPYFFINMNTYGSLGVLKNAFAILIAYLMIGYGLLGVKTILGRKTKD